MLLTRVTLGETAQLSDAVGGSVSSGGVGSLQSRVRFGAQLISGGVVSLIVTVVGGQLAEAPSVSVRVRNTLQLTEQRGEVETLRIGNPLAASLKSAPGQSVLHEYVK